MSRLDFDGYFIERPFDFARHATIGCGGISREAFFPKSEESFVRLLEDLEKEGKAYRVLGCLSNVLPADGVSKRAVVCTRRMKNIREEDGVYIEAGVTVGALLRYCRKVGLSGVEFLTGIPCTLGGALYMNAGVGGEYIADTVEFVQAYIEGKVERLSVAECGYSYKNSAFMQNGAVILGAKLKWKRTDTETVENRIAIYEKRRAHLPKGRSMGCVFKNPRGYTAGKLIEGAGLKDYRFGGARISKEHANFIINDGHATSEEIKNLISVVKSAVFAQYRIVLQEEIRYLD